MSKSPEKHTKSKSIVETTPRLRYGPASQHYFEFVKRFAKSMIIPKSKVTYLFKALKVLSLCKDQILFCLECKCFFTTIMYYCKHPESTVKSIRQLMAQYNIKTIERMTDVIDMFYKKIDGSYITEDGWK